MALESRRTMARLWCSTGRLPIRGLPMRGSNWGVRAARSYTRVVSLLSQSKGNVSPCLQIIHMLSVPDINKKNAIPSSTPRLLFLHSVHHHPLNHPRNWTFCGPHLIYKQNLRRLEIHATTTQTTFPRSQEVRYVYENGYPAVERTFHFARRLR